MIQEFLFLYNQMHLRSDGAIGFPGGIVEPGESVLEGAEREFLEETGSVIKLTKEGFIAVFSTDFNFHRNSRVIF